MHLKPMHPKPMYALYFGLNKEPFSIAPDPRFLFMSEQHREALAHLLYGLGAGGGFVLLTGEIGAGKTTVCRCFLEQVPANCSVAYVFNPKLTALELLQTVCAEFGLDTYQAAPAAPTSIKALVDALNAFLLDQHAQGRQAVLVIDEAQSLSPDVLEQLRLLTNLETAERKLLQIVLIGQPELRDLLARPELEQLAQRVVARYHLGALSAAQTAQYIGHRLAVAGTTAQRPFDAQALARIHALSAGVPRRINLLADRALLGTYAQGRAVVDRRTVQQAAREVFGPRPGYGAWRLSPMPVELAVALGAALAAIVLLVALALAWTLGSSRARGPAISGVESAVVGSAAPDLSASPALATASQASAVAVDMLRDATPVIEAAQTVQATAWRELALRWQVAIGEGDPCVVAAQAQLGCFRSAAGGLALVRQLDRPGVLTLRLADRESVYVLLLALGPQHATLQAGARTFQLTLPTLASVWLGDFATFWRLPPGWRAEDPPVSAAAVGEPLRTWIETRLLAAGFVPGPVLTERVRAFQLAQALTPDGLIGPLTLMQLSRIALEPTEALAGVPATSATPATPLPEPSLAPRR